MESSRRSLGVAKPIGLSGLIGYLKFLNFSGFLELNSEKTNFPMVSDYFLGKDLFSKNCSVCHENKGNIILPEKNLHQETLETNGMYNIEAINYQILNGKNGMPAFGGKLNEKQIKEIATYILSP